jgi:formylglycine-generating enzyme required for sulfatase activity
MLPALTACSNAGTSSDSEDKSDPMDHTSTYHYTLIFPFNVPNFNSPIKAPNNLVDCDEAGIQTIRFTFYTAANEIMDEHSWQCSLHRGEATGLPLGNGIRVVVTAEDAEENGRVEGVETQHRVTLTQPIYMQTTEVTQAHWQAVMQADLPSFFY